MWRVCLSRREILLACSLWSCKSGAHLKQTLQQMGHQVAETTIRRLLRAQGYSLRANKKNIEGTSHPDRDAQFEQINTKCKTFRSEEHTSELQSHLNLVCRLLLEKK